MFNSSVRAPRRPPAAALVLLLACPARAEEPAPAPPPLESARLQRLEARLQQLEEESRVARRLQEIAQAQAAAAKPVQVAAAPGRGFTVALADGRFSFGARARVQVRDTFTVAGGATANEINFKTIRLWLTGNLLVPDLKYGVQLAFGPNDFDPTSATPLFDAFLEYTKLRDLNLKVGQFFVPFDRLRTVRESSLQLVDRPQPITELTLDRDVGVAISSQDLFGARGILNYQLAIFGGEGRNRFGGQPAPGGLYVARLGVRPLGPFDDDSEGDLERLPRPRLSFGVAAAYNQGTNRQRSTTGATLTFSTVDYVHAAVDLILKSHGFYFAGEFVLRQGLVDNREGVKDGVAVKEWSRSGYGYVTQASYMLHRQVEIIGRWSQLFALGATDPAWIKQVAEQGHELGGGLSVYLNGHLFKLQADYFYLFGEFNQGRHAARVQLDATF